MIAFHFPPAAMGSGHLRTLGFARYLPAAGWDPVVLSASSRAYPRIAPIDPDAIPLDCPVHRALAFDARRHFGIGGRYPAFLAQPDRWRSWSLAAVCQGLRLIRRHRVRAIWSTYPIMTAHCIARTLSGFTRLPWVADFRDPVFASVEPGNPFSVASQSRWERRVLGHATRSVFTTPGALRDYAERYPAAQREGRLAVIGNGYDERAFTDLSIRPPRHDGRPLVLLHSGLLYTDGRNPKPFLSALARLRAAGDVTPGELRVVLRGSGSEATYERDIQDFGLEDMVVLAPPVSNQEALCEQADADALLVFQGQQFDRQIPAKLYEYFRIGRPVFALVGMQGDTAALLRSSGGAEVVPIDDAAVIAERLLSFLHALRTGCAQQINPDAVTQYSRRTGAMQLARLLDQACARSPA